MFLRTRRGVSGATTTATVGGGGNSGSRAGATSSSSAGRHITTSAGGGHHHHHHHNGQNHHPIQQASTSSSTSDAFYLLFNILTSNAVTFVNEAVFSKAEFGFPSILCLNGFIATFVGTEILRWFGQVQPIQEVPSSTTTPSASSLSVKQPSSPVPLPSPSTSTTTTDATSSELTTTTTTTPIIKPSPSTATHGVTIRDPNFLVLVLVVGLSKTLNNVSLKHNSMGVYQIFKLLVTPAIVLLEYCLDGKILSVRRAICLGCVCFFCVGSINGDLQISPVGLVWATVWVPIAAIFKVQWARVKRRYRCSTVSLMHAVMPYACFLQLAIAPVVDPPGLFSYQWTTQTVMLLSASAFGAFFVLYSSFLVLGHVGPLSHTLLGPLKTFSTMMGSAILFKTQYSTTQLITAAGALLSLAAYTHVTVNEQRQHKQQHEDDDDDDDDDEVVPLVPVSTTNDRPESSSSSAADILLVEKGDDTVSTATSNSVSGDEEDVLALTDEKGIRDPSMDDSETSFV